MKGWPWWQRATLVAAFAAGGLPPLARMLIGPPGAVVHVRWQSSTDASTRLDLEERFRLADGEPLGDRTWRYELIDPSSENIRTLVANPAVQDTHHIDRPLSSLAASSARTARRLRLPSGGDRVVSVVDGFSQLLAGLAVLLVGAGIAGLAQTWRDTRRLLGRPLRFCWDSTDAAATAVSGWLQRGIPEVEATAVGLFRIVFGGAAVAFFATHPVDPSWLSDTFDLELETRPSAVVLDWLRSHPAVVELLAPWLLCTGVAFSVGLFTRLSYPLFVATALLWAYVATSISTTAHHPVGPFLVALVALIPSRWGDALSIDAWLRRTRGYASAAQPAGKQYGYTVWVPGLVLGLGLAAAAWAKLSVPPHWTDWILNGTVKYHFIRDSANAPVDWGLQLAGYPLLAIVASLGVVLMEAAVITTAFVRNQWYRLAVGAAAVPLAGGFYLFMGVFWPSWWILLMALLPWQWISHRFGPALESMEVTREIPSRGPEASSSGWLRAVQLALVVVVVTQQLVSSGLKVERVPIFSWYDMYSSTYESPEHWAASRSPDYHLALLTDRGRTELPACDPYPAFVRAFERALEGSAEARERIWNALRACDEDLTDVRNVTLEGDMQIFDWNRLAFGASQTFTLGPLLAEAEAVTSAR